MRKSRKALGVALVLVGGALTVGSLYFPKTFDLRKAFFPNNQNIVVRVAGHPISKDQLKRAALEQLWLDGKTEATASTEELKAARDGALHDLIDHELLRLEVKSSDPEIGVSAAEIDQRVQQIENRFEDPAKLEQALKAQGLGEIPALRERFAAMIRQEKWIAAKIAKSVRTSDAEAREWYDKNPSAMANPERIEARHVFIATLEHPPEEAKQKLDTALVELTEKRKDFATLAKELSEDEATKNAGGALGWLTRERLPADFAAALFYMEPNKPELVRTKLGWHLVEITARKAAEPRAFEQAKPEIIAALEAVKRVKAVEDLRKKLYANAIEAGKITFYP